MKRKYNVINPLKKSPGIYKISCTESDKIYIGETVNLSQRLQKHFSLLRKNKHSNPILQNIFNKYGEETFIVEVLEYLDIIDDIKLKTIERNWQLKFDNCISMDSNEIYHIERNEEWKESQRKQLNEIRKTAIEICSKSVIIYNINTKEFIEYKTLTDASKIMDRKHIDKNINEKILIPYNHIYVAFLKEDFNEENIKKIITVSENVSYTSNRTQCDLYNLLTDEEFHFTSKTQFSIHINNTRNNDLYSRYENTIDVNFNCTKLPNTLKDLNDMYICIKKRSWKTKCNFNLWYKALKEGASSRSMESICKINRSTIQEAIKDRSKEEWIRLIDIVYNKYKL